MIDPQQTNQSETETRQHLALVALAKRPADVLIGGVTLLNVFTLEWLESWDVVIASGRIAWTGPSGQWPGEAAEIVDRRGFYAVPGFGEPHKHIESTHLTPEYEAALVLPDGNTWTVEASHEFANVNGRRNVEFWLTARKHGSPLKIFPVPGSATPPTAFEETGGYNGYEQVRQDLENLAVPGLDEVMDWSAVWNPENPGYERLWGAMRATWEARGVVAGHGTGLHTPGEISAFAAAGLSSDHECRQAEEAWNKLARGVFLMLRPVHGGVDRAIPYFVQRGLKDWSNVSLTTDDRDAAETLEKGSCDFNVRCAIEAGAPVEAAYAMASYYPARYWHLEHLVGSVAPGRYADLVLLSDPKNVAIDEVFADGKLVAKRGRYLLDVPKIEWPSWATQTMQVGGTFQREDFEIASPAGARDGHATAAVLEPFSFRPDFTAVQLPIIEGRVERGENATKFAIIDRYHGVKSLSKMFWINVGPKTAGSALACSVAHDHHNVWVLGSSDAAMAQAANALVTMGGGWVLVHAGEITATVRFEVGGLMTARPAEAVAADLRNLWTEAEKLEWLGGPGIPFWTPGLPKRMVFATLTCTPWHWVLVAPSRLAPQGFVDVTTGKTHPVVW
ncbi:MAG TPA: adenine deaminase C-terminal domain-containing protein [Chthoniobacterales bacterium]